MTIQATAAAPMPVSPDRRPPAIQTRGLTKVFGRQTVVKALDLSVPAGSVFGFLGPNGSGKTTTIRILLGLASASSGSVSLLGRPMPDRAAEVLPRVGALVEGPGFYPYLSGRANLVRLDAADPLTPPSTRRARVDGALERVGLTHAATKKVHAYSLGMKQRLGIANALLTERDLLVLDEPSNGLDPQGTREVRGLIRALAADGTTVFVSSHLLSEIEQMCTHVAVMSVGRLVAQGPMADLRAEGQARIRVHTPDTASALATLIGLGLAPEQQGDSVLADLAVGVRTTDPGAAHEPTDTSSTRTPSNPAAGTPAADPVAVEAVVAALVADGVRVRGVGVEGESLEDRFVALTGEGFDVAG